MKIRYLPLFFLCFSLFAGILPLQGEKYDYLVDFKRQKVVCGIEEFSFDSQIKAGYFFVYEKNLYCLNKGELRNLNRKNRLIARFDKAILPCSDFLPFSIQDLILDNLLFIPVQDGFFVFDMEERNVKGRLKCVFDRSETDIVLPDILVQKDYFFLVFNKRVEIYGNFERKNTFYFKNSIFFDISVGDDFFTILSVEKPGGLFSIKTVLKAYDFDFKLLNTKELEVFPKNIFRAGGDFVFETKEISVFSLFGSKKIHFVKTDLKHGKIKEYSFSVSHKRRHVFPFYYGKKIFLVIQCKDGKVYFLDLNRDKKKRLDKKVYYDYTFLKGKKGGVFYEKSSDNYFPVRFELSFLSRIF